MRVQPSTLRAIKNVYQRMLYPTARENAAQELKWLRKELPTHKLGHACWLRGRGYPLQYILGSQPFTDFSVVCRPGVLIPRWETEEWTVQLQPHVKHIRGVELCTGTGCVAFALERAGMSVNAVDISDKAQSVFAENKRLLKSRANFILADIARPIGLQCDLLVANPPYVTSASSLDPSVRTFEPKLALFGDCDILDSCLERAVETQARASVIEIGSAQQTEYLLRQFRRLGWSAEGRLDGAGRPRTVWAHKGDSFL